ncbi:hypothetical protein COCC4DRAFT_19184 [Bipolaris maydis ATCC 48331]|uniref:Uncharacterized protein n=2 Tax=Cochliobolus heterostrophus TaxID=5016 RepID=M2TUC0_COCH5|nr:uncharacterized protein COCC4DRAFT_19184 [Bipolaris maydis ATCC 48331]EMD90134.1 hypothetical protein COCHEDRAFT_1178551 [Bipolaris maydis C5]KAH7563046.1 hypothetical protein BM1_00093 [Bipolaris maydis]ENI09651.1 hypothetical protein COCC4DRAFT_19184 [Bipolaris maydis ATCC 48331]KAJ5025199.1 hypothetical protein J3E73DRAFT_382334 [Bipolaris maydis]KAJ5063788.1 hypothetical protein J3E74DRAFT_261608 [Bipolaris maydis]
MHFTQLFTIATGATLAAAAPAAAPAAQPAPIAVAMDDVVLHGNGRLQVMKRSEFDQLFPVDKYPVGTPSQFEPNLITYTGAEIAKMRSSSLSKRDTSIVIPGKTTTFTGWDVQVSQIIQGGLETKITVAAGYSISNSISVSVGVDATIIEDFLKTSMSVTKTWETTNSLTQTFYTDVPEGKWGAWVFRPLTTRYSGAVWHGKMGDTGSVSTWQADSFSNKSYNGMDWIDGYFAACFQDTFPMPRCQGGGFL